MKLLDKFIWLSAIFLFALSSLTAQEDVLRPKGKPEGYGDDFFVYQGSPWAIGLEGGLNYNMFKQDQVWDFLDDRPNPSINEVFRKASGISPHFAVFVDYSFNNQSALQLRIGWEQRNYSNKITDSAYTMLGEGVKVDFENMTKTTWSSIALLYRHSFTNNFFGTIGLLQENLNGTPQYEQTLHTYDGTPVSSINWIAGAFTDNDDTQTITGDLNKAEFNSSRTAIEIGAGYKFDITPRFKIVPQARFQFFVTDVMKEVTYEERDLFGNLEGTLSYENRQLHGLQFALALWFNL